MQTIRWSVNPTDRLRTCSYKHAEINFSGSELFHFYIFPFMFSLKEKLIEFYM